MNSNALLTPSSIIRRFENNDPNTRPAGISSWFEYAENTASHGPIDSMIYRGEGQLDWVVDPNHSDWSEVVTFMNSHGYSEVPYLPTGVPNQFSVNTLVQRAWANLSNQEWYLYRELDNGNFEVKTSTVQPELWRSSGHANWTSIEHDMRSSGFNETNGYGTIGANKVLTGSRGVVKIAGKVVGTFTGGNFSIEGRSLPDAVDFDEPTDATVERWKKEGKCPKCGELGPFVRGYMTCSKHGVY